MKLTIILFSFIAVALARDSGPEEQIAQHEVDAPVSKMSSTSETRDRPDDKAESPEVKTPEVKKKLTRAEMEAMAARLDREEIFFLTHDNFAASVKKDTWLVFFGAKWCKFCQRMTPKWIKLQDRVEEKLSNDFRFRVAKVDCTHDEAFCGRYGIDAYPTIVLYNKGKPIEEYHSDTDLKSLFDYSTAMARKYYTYAEDAEDHDEL